MKSILICLFLLPLPAARAEHNALLARPQQVEYGSGALALRGLSLRFTSPPSAEDRFAAEQLAARLSATTQAKVEIRRGKSSDRTIVLNRTEESGALPADNERAGPDSRESYTLSVTPKGAEVRGRSSGGVFFWGANFFAKGGGGGGR